MILRSIFSHWGQSRDSNTNIKKGSNIHWCSWRNHDALRAGGENCWTGWRFFFLILLKYIYIYIFFFFSFSTSLQKQQKILGCFPEDKLSVIYLDLQIQKVIIPWLLMHRDSYEIENWVKVLQIWVSGFRNDVTSKYFMCKPLKKNGNKVYILWLVSILFTINIIRIALCRSEHM